MSQGETVQWPEDPRVSKGCDVTLEDKLNYIAVLERRHGFLGVCVFSKDGASRTAEALADFVIDCLHSAIAGSRDRNNLVVVG